MKKLSLNLIFIFFFISTCVVAQQKEVLTNGAIIQMYSKKLPASIIIGKIKSSQNNFDVNTDALISLTDNNIPEDIINAMVDAANDNSRHIVVLDPNNPEDMHESGIYYFKKSMEKSELVQLEPTIYSQSNSSGAIGSALTYGIAKVKTSVTLDGKNAQLQIDEEQPVFYFYFDITGNSLSQSANWWFSAATSPNEFLLVKLSENKKTREVTTGSANIAGTSIGVDNKNKAAFKIEKIATGIYKVSFEKALSGEYCFMYAGSVPNGYTSVNKVFDFGIENK